MENRGERDWEQNDSTGCGVQRETDTQSVRVCLCLALVQTSQFCVCARLSSEGDLWPVICRQALLALMHSETRSRLFDFLAHGLVSCFSTWRQVVGWNGPPANCVSGFCCDNVLSSSFTLLNSYRPEFCLQAALLHGDYHVLLGMLAVNLYLLIFILNNLIGALYDGWSDDTKFKTFLRAQQKMLAKITSLVCVNYKVR